MHTFCRTTKAHPTPHQPPQPCPYKPIEVTAEQAAEKARRVADEMPSPPDSLPPPLIHGKTTATPPSESLQQSAKENESGSGSDGTQTHTAKKISWPRDNEERATELGTIVNAFYTSILSLKDLGMVPTESDSELQLTRTGRVDISSASLNDELLEKKGWTFL